MARCALILLGLVCSFAATAGQAPAPAPAPAVAPPQDITSVVNAAVAAAQAAQSAAAASLEAALNLQRTLGLSPAQPQPAQPQAIPLPMPAAAPAPEQPVPPVSVAVGGAPTPTPMQEQPAGAAPAAGGTFAVPGFEQPLAGTAGAGAPPLAGLAAPSAEVQAVLGEQGGLPAQALPAGLPARLAESLQGQQPQVQGGGSGR